MCPAREKTSCGFMLGHRRVNYLAFLQPPCVPLAFSSGIAIGSYWSSKPTFCHFLIISPQFPRIQGLEANHIWYICTEEAVPVEGLAPLFPTAWRGHVVPTVVGAFIGKPSNHVCFLRFHFCCFVNHSPGCPWQWGGSRGMSV